MTDLHQVIDDRNAYSRKRAETVHAFIEAMKPIIAADFAHQIGPRGCSLSASYHEVKDNNEIMHDIISEEVNAYVCQLFRAYQKEGRR